MSSAEIIPFPCRLPPAASKPIGAQFPQPEEEWFAAIPLHIRGAKGVVGLGVNELCARLAHLTDEDPRSVPELIADWKGMAGRLLEAADLLIDAAKRADFALKIPSSMLPASH
jgi:hypothetical protein